MTQRQQLLAEQLLAGRYHEQVDNSAFVAHESAADAVHTLALKLDISETRMHCNHQGVQINGGAIDLFPGVTLRLTSDNGNLVPLDRDLLRDPQGDGYWDISLSPGRVWSEPADGPWSRAVLPFQLSNIFENDTHHGLATFLYNETSLSPIFFQIVAETKAFLCPENLQASGWLTATTAPLASVAVGQAITTFRTEAADRRAIKSLSDWQSPDTQLYLDDIERGFGSDSTMVSGLVVDDDIYTSSCHTSMGDYPYPRAMKFGIWSATKTAFCSIACLRIAQLCGQDPRSASIGELLPEARDSAAWSDITIGDCLNMATGIGTAVRVAEPASIFADYLLEESEAQQSAEARTSFNHYHAWFLAPSQHEKNAAAFACPQYSWPAGRVVRYRDQDIYIAGAALDAFLKRLHGVDARIWDMVRDEVYTPARIHHAIKFHTIEADISQQVPLSDAGLLLTMDNIAGLGKLIHDNGGVGDDQILHPGMLQEFFDPQLAKGLPTGIHIDDGEVHYHAGIWHLPYRTRAGELLWIPSMRGYGGQIIQTLPNGITSFRFGADSYATEERYDALKLVKLADAIRPF